MWPNIDEFRPCSTIETHNVFTRIASPTIGSVATTEPLFENLRGNRILS